MAKLPIVGRADMSAKPDKLTYENTKIQTPKPMTDAMELSNVEPMNTKRYPTTRQMKYGGTVTYTNGPRKIRT
jgi:hypothetical protein